MNENAGIKIRNAFEEKVKENSSYWKDRQKKTEESLIKKFGSLEEAQQSRIEKQKITLKEKYGEEITNGSQTEEAKRKIREAFEERKKDPNFLKERAEKARATKIKKYGSWENYQQHLRDKVKKTCLEKYGTESVMQSEVVKEKSKKGLEDKLKNNPYYYEERAEKTKQTLIDHYGSHEEYISHMKKACEKTYLEKYGVDNPNKSSLVKTKRENTLQIILRENPNYYEERWAKTKNTLISKYGSLEKYFDEANEKRKKTCLEKYGVSSITQTEDQKLKSRQTKLDNYGDEYYNNPQQTKQTIIEKFGNYYNLKTLEQREAVKREILKQNLLKYKEEDFSHKGFTFFLKDNIPFVRCNKCGDESPLELPPSLIRNNLYCKVCNPEKEFGKSKAENDINNIINSWGVETETHNRKILDGKEIDIYIPSHNLAIEYNGLWWHRYKGELDNFPGGHSDKKHLLEKTKKCQEQNIHLIHISEEEWGNKPDIVVSMLKRFLDKIPLKIGARKCEVKPLDNKSYNNFVEENHLQGKAKASIKLGLFSNNEIVACMSFSKSRFSKTEEGVYEMVRYCERKDVVVLGGRNKLLSFFEKNYNPLKIISYCDRRWFTGSSYEKLGFVMKEETQPNFRYFKNVNQTFNRINFQKHKLKQLDDFVYDENLSEIENMLVNNYNLVYDCGTLRYEKEYIH